MQILTQDAGATVFMVSRRGILPQVHSAYLPSAHLPTFRESRNLKLVLNETREQVETLKAGGHCWRAVIDSLRPISNQIWRDLPAADRLRFIRHLKSYWEPFRHRMGPEIAERTEAFRLDGKLRVLTGKVRRISRVGDALEVAIEGRSLGDVCLKVDRVINCTGLHESYEHSSRPIIRELIESGLAVANDVGTGFRTA